MTDLRTSYLNRYGVHGAPLAFAQDLMRGDPDTFKVGYTADNAALATADFFALDEVTSRNSASS